MAHFSSMVDMARSPVEVKKDAGISVESPTKPSGPVYPYGLCIALGEDELKKLGIDGEMPAVGDMIHLCALAKVTSVSQNETEDTDGAKQTHCRVELQITHLATEAEDQEDAAIEAAEQKVQARRGRFYGGGEAA